MKSDIADKQRKVQKILETLAVSVDPYYHNLAKQALADFPDPDAVGSLEKALKIALLALNAGRPCTASDVIERALAKLEKP